MGSWRKSALDLRSSGGCNQDAQSGDQAIGIQNLLNPWRNGTCDSQGPGTASGALARSLKPVGWLPHA